MGRLLRHRDARLYLLGQSLSTVGDSALWLAMGIWVKILTGSSSEAGLVFFAFTAGLVLAPVTGLIADRLRRRPLLIGANLGSALLVCALLAVRGQPELWLVYLVMFGYGALNSLISSAQTALLAVMLPPDLLGEANSVLQMAAMGLRVVSPLLGAGLLAWVGPAPVVLLDAGTFLAAAACLAALRLREPRPAPAETRWQAEVTAGIRHIGRTEALRRLLVTGVIALLVFGFFETVPFAVVGQGLHRPPAFLGVVEALVGVGALGGGALATPLMRRVGERVLMVLALLIAGTACLLLIPSSLPVVLAAAGLLGLAIVWFNVGSITMIQRLTAASLLGRVDAALNVAITVPQVISIATGAALIAVVNYRVLLVVMAAVIMASALYLAGPRRSARATPAATPAATTAASAAAPALPDEG